MTGERKAGGHGESVNAEVYRRLGSLLAEAGQRYGVPPRAVEEKAALEARRAAEQAVPSGAEQIIPETRWTEGKMETPGVRFFEYEYTLRLAVPFGQGADILPAVRAYWLSRGMDVVPEEDSPAGDVVANPDKGEWTLRAGVLDPVTVFIRVASGPVLTSPSPAGNERQA